MNIAKPIRVAIAMTTLLGAWSATAGPQELAGLPAAQRQIAQQYLDRQDGHSLADEALLRDLDGDGQPELLLRWSLLFGNSQSAHLTVFRLDKGRWRPGKPVDIRGDPQGGLQFGPGGRLQLDTLTTAPQDPRCCPSLKLTLRWRYAGGQLQALSTP